MNGSACRSVRGEGGFTIRARIAMGAGTGGVVRPGIYTPLMDYCKKSELKKEENVPKY
jgi:hypothetical protein